MITAPFPTKAGLTTPTFCEEIWIRICARWAGYASVIANLCLTNKTPFALNNIDKDVKGLKAYYPAKILTKRLMRVRNAKNQCLNIFGGLFWKFLFSTCITVSQAYYSYFNFPLYYLTCVGLRYETSILTTISKRAHRRFLQLIHVKGAAVLHFNVVFPPTTIVWPMIANCTSHFTFCNRRMLSFDPSWGMRTTTTHGWTWSGHLWVTSNTSVAIPTRGDISLITSDLALTSESDKTICCIEALVFAAWVVWCVRCNCWSNIYQLVSFTEYISTLEPINKVQGRVL